MKIIAISDTHGLHRNLTVPDGDLILFAGDFTGGGTVTDYSNLKDFVGWLRELPHRWKVMIAGNHDFIVEERGEFWMGALCALNGIHYLQDSSVTVGGLKIWGSPWQPRFFNWAFNLDRGPALAEKWAQIPPDTDILLTHGPPSLILDETDTGRSVGCEELLARLEDRGLDSIRLHVFGHIHESYGQEEETLCGGAKRLFVNASIWDHIGRKLNEPAVIDGLF